MFMLALYLQLQIMTGDVSDVPAIIASKVGRVAEQLFRGEGAAAEGRRSSCQGAKELLP